MTSENRPCEFERSRLVIEPLCRRENDLDLGRILPLGDVDDSAGEFNAIAERIVTARRKGAEVILMMGAHVLRDGVQRHLIDMMEHGWITCIALNGAGVIHDFEFASIGGTTESVARYIRDGRFGMWMETGRINDIVSAAAKEGKGLGEAAGKAIAEGSFPHAGLSVIAAAYRFGIPVTVHVGIGYDIVFQHPNCDGGAYGKTSYLDFLRFAKRLENLEHGVVMNFGSAVMAPEIYLKGLSMARNVARQEGRRISRFSTLVCDLVKLPEDFRHEAGRDEAGYYFRPWKTMLVRTVADGGESFYVRGTHRENVPRLRQAVNRAAGKGAP